MSRVALGLAAIAATLQLAAVPAAAHTGEHRDEAQPEAAPAEEIEALDDIEVVEAEVEGAADAPISAKELIGRLHPLLVHFPIAWLVLLVAFEVLALRRAELDKLGLPLVVLVVASFVPGVVTGLLRLGHFEEEGADLGPALAHRNAMFTCLGLLLVAAGLRYWRRAGLTSGWRYTYVALIAFAALFVALGGHLGGELVYGADYLPW